ncbi:MAG: hypothetical protein JWN76_2272 [Chitinophagaceae bacterium]|nr:hypothetical protein [Chitinophagaceae bacterium]
MLHRILILIALSLNIYSCNSQKTGKAATGYDLAKPVKTWNMPGTLNEISGVTWIDNNHLMAIEDLHANLYLLNIQKGQVEKTIPFETSGDKKFDIEDVTIANNVVYALWSHGAIFKITNWASKPGVTEIPTFLKKKNNTEGICFDPVSNTLLVACKDDADVKDEKKSTRAVYSFDLSSGKLKENPFLVINKKDFKNAGSEKINFFPSAIAVHPVTHDIYILSTKDTKCMACFGRDGKLKAFESINKDLMPQPEGICFSPDGTLYITTQSRHNQPAKVFQFKHI